MSERVYNVLFLCTGNSARSIIGEAVLNHLGEGRFKAYSAGSQPKGSVHPLALKVLKEAGIPSDGASSKSWTVFADPDAPVMDFIFTVCDSAAGESCPHWPGQPFTAHWGIEDPAAVEGTEIERERAFVTALRYLRNRIVAFTALPVNMLDRASLQSQLREIGQTEGVSSPRQGAA
ncbi:arsenate reductase ArsC [Microvirga antarctica]|uniref:arsenate reductase ArsC n=1 Tax=Microvirga antarctica TaxID=2819233 RepID=UPI001B302335|nr:arsenate reductase ArsC [Microvirga antarctica]